jgi:hypothetical protein
MYYFWYQVYIFPNTNKLETCDYLCLMGLYKNITLLFRLLHIYENLPSMFLQCSPLNLISKSSQNFWWFSGVLLSKHGDYFSYSLRNFHFIEIITSAYSKYFFTLLSLNFSWLRHTSSYVRFVRVFVRWYHKSGVLQQPCVYIPKGTNKIVPCYRMSRITYVNLPLMI